MEERWGTSDPGNHVPAEGQKSGPYEGGLKVWWVNLLIRSRRKMLKKPQNLFPKQQAVDLSSGQAQTLLCFPSYQPAAWCQATDSENIFKKDFCKQAVGIQVITFIGPPSPSFPEHKNLFSSEKDIIFSKIDFPMRQTLPRKKLGRWKKELQSQNQLTFCWRRLPSSIYKLALCT